jgi:hypothetical protein
MQRHSIGAIQPPTGQESLCGMRCHLWVSTKKIDIPANQPEVKPHFVNDGIVHTLHPSICEGTFSSFTGCFLTAVLAFIAAIAQLFVRASVNFTFINPSHE